MRGDFRKGKRLPVKSEVKDYRVVRSPNGRKIYLHRERAERALGRALRGSEEVHHADGSTRDDAPLVICQDRAYHKMLHRRMKIVKAGGNPNTDKVCSRCRAVKSRTAFSRCVAQPDGLNHYCKPCQAQWTSTHRKEASL